MARSILGHNLDSIREDGTIEPTNGEISRLDEPGHAALAIGEFYRATGETTLDGYDLVDLAARCITAQAFLEPIAENGLAYSALALLSFGPAKDRNPVWERLVDPTREQLDRLLLARSDYENHWQAFNIAKAVARFSMGLSKKDETSRLIDRFIERIQSKSSQGYCDDNTDAKLGGVFDLYGVLSFVFIRQALQLHSNIHLRDRKLPSLRTCAERYVKMLPDLVRQDGLGWAYGRGIGAYGQMHCISLLLQSMRDGWIADDQKARYSEILRRLFSFFFLTYLDQEHGYLVIRDEERTTIPAHTTRMANFDGARYLSQWSRLAKSIDAPAPTKPTPAKTGGRFVMFDKSGRKEQGLFIYQDTESGLHFQLPLVGASPELNSDSLPFPHCPGIFDWPANTYLPIMIPELTFGDQVIIPAFYGKQCVTGLGLRRSLNFRYEQPELINTQQEMVNGLGSCKVSWSFSGSKITSEFAFSVKQPVQLDRMRYVLAIGTHHNSYHVDTCLALGPEGQRCEVLKDDFQAHWGETEVVSENPDYRGYFGKIHYLQFLTRDHPLQMRPGQQYKLVVSFDPDISLAGA